MNVLYNLNLHFTLLLIISTTYNAQSQDLSSCTDQLVTLQDDMNGYSSSATVEVEFINNCGCNNIGNCQKLSVQIPNNYTCEGLVVSLSNTQLWYDDYFDLFYIPQCQYLGDDDYPNSQKSNYIIAIDPIQTGGEFEFLICAGEDLPLGQNLVEIDITTSDLCTVEDCSNDTSPPTCEDGPFTVQLDPGQHYYTFDINDFASDACSPILTYENASIDLSSPNGTPGEFWSGYNDQFPCGTYIIDSATPFDDAGNFNYCSFTFEVECGGDSSVCNNTVLDFDGIDDYVELSSPFSGDQGYTIEMWVLSQSSSTGTCSNNSSADLDWILSFDDNNLGMVDCSGEFRVIFRPLCPQGNGLCSSLPSRPLDDGQWHHIAISEGTGSGFKVYYDGIKFTNFSNDTYDLSGIIRIGNNFSNAGNPFKGRIDNVRIWNYIRSEEEILENYRCHYPIDDSGLEIFYDFENGIGGMDNTTILEVIDLANQDQPGELHGFTLDGQVSNFVCDTLTLLSDCNLDPDPCDSDITPPVLTCPIGTLPIDVQIDGTASAVFSDFNITATDNCDMQVDISDVNFNLDCSNVGGPAIYTTVTATDDNGNSSTCQVGVQVFDPNGFCCSHPDFAGLQAFYDAANGDQWSNTIANNRPWFEDCDPCGILDGTPWYGITCNANNQVTHLGLNFNNLSGIISPDIELITQLSNIVIYDNVNLTGPIPNTICNLNNLIQFYAFRNGHNGTIPTCIGDPSLLPLLTDFQIQNNNIEGEIPPFSNPNLFNIVLNDNLLTGGIPTSLSSLSNLSTVTFNNNLLSGCYDQDLLNLCNSNMGTIQGLNNSSVSDGNMFDATWENFCDFGDGMCTVNTDESIKTSVIVIVPNPVSQILKLNLEFDYVEVFDVFGNRSMHASNFERKGTIDVSSLSNGAYFINCFYNGELLGSGRFVKIE